MTDLVTISSTMRRVARPASSVCNITKFGDRGAEALRQELLSRQVRVSVIGSGTADTELTTYLREEIRQTV
jgi:NADP-dependent 3-hydroxy acid dehydrogenase YdfG